MHTSPHGSIVKYFQHRFYASRWFLNEFIYTDMLLCDEQSLLYDSFAKLHTKLTDTTVAALENLYVRPSGGMNQAGLLEFMSLIIGLTLTFLGRTLIRNTASL